MIGGSTISLYSRVPNNFPKYFYTCQKYNNRCGFIPYQLKTNNLLQKKKKVKDK